MSSTTKTEDRTESILKKRLDKLFKDLPPNEAKQLFEELIEEYTYAAYGVSVLDEIKEVSTTPGTRLTIQRIGLVNKGILISRNGFTTVSTTLLEGNIKQFLLQENDKPVGCGHA